MLERPPVSQSSSCTKFTIEESPMDTIGIMDAPLEVDDMLTAVDKLLQEVEGMVTTGDKAEAELVWESHQQERGSQGDAVHQAKKYKATYYQRKDEIDELKDEAAALEDVLSRVKQAVAVKGQPKALVHLYQEDIKRTNFQSAGVQAMLSSYHSAVGRAPALVPTAIHLHLPVDMAARANILNSMREPKLRTAMRFLAERTGSLDLRQRHRHLDVFDLSEGDLISTGLDIFQFKSGHSVRQVFDEFMILASNHQASSLKTGGIHAVREDFENREAIQIAQSRQVTALTESLSFESNMVMLSMCIDGNEDSRGYAFVTIDFVDQDDLCPYHPETFARKQLTAAFLITEIATPTGRIVSVAGWSHVRFQSPQRELTPAEKHAVRANNDQWRDTMPKIIRKNLARYPPATQ